MMRLTRKLYSEPEDEENENDEKTWKRRRNIGIIGAGTGAAMYVLVGKGGKGFTGTTERKAKEAIEGKAKEGAKKYVTAYPDMKKARWIGGAMMGAGTLLGVGSEIKRRKLKKKKDDENKT